MTTPGREVMAALKDAGPDYKDCVWCNHPTSTIGSGADLCMSCRAIRKADKKDVGYCRGGCGCKLLWQYIRCTPCRKADKWDEDYVAHTSQVNPDGIRRPTGKNAARYIRDIEAFYAAKGEPVPWKDGKPAGGTWG